MPGVEKDLGELHYFSSCGVALRLLSCIEELCLKSPKILYQSGEKPSEELSILSYQVSAPFFCGVTTEHPESRQCVCTCNFV